MSQIFPQAEDPNIASIPIAKFSHNTCPYGTRNFTWTHISLRNDLSFVVRQSRVVDDHGNFNERLVLKIVAGAELLETQDLGQLVQYCQEFNPSSGAEHPVQVVVKCPFMAMRYPKSTNTIRRLQVKFQNPSDFAKAVNIMQEIGLLITENMPPAQPTQLSISSPAPSTNSLSGFNAGPTIPSSRPTSANVFMTPASARSSGTPSFLAPNSEFRIPARPDSSSSQTSRPFSAMSYSLPSIPRSASTSSASSALAHPEPSLYVSQIERGLPGRRLSPSNIGRESRQDQVSQSQLKSSQGDEDHTRLGSASGTVSPFFSVIAPTSMADPFSQSHNPARSELSRPASTPVDYTLPNWTVVYNNPSAPSIPQSKARAASIPILPPLPKPTPVARSQSSLRSPETSKEFIPTPTHKPAKKRVAQRKSTNVSIPNASIPNESVPAEILQLESSALLGNPKMLENSSSFEKSTKQAIVFEKPAEPEEEPSPLAAKSAAIAARPASAMASLQSKATVTKKRAAAPIRPLSAAKRPKMVNATTQTQTLSGRDHTVARRDTPANEIPTKVPALVADTPSPESPPDSYLDGLDKFVTKHKLRPAPKELWEAPGYTDADDEQRYLMLNDFVCDNLENEDFLQLCKDTETAWRRIGLGM